MPQLDKVTFLSQYFWLFVLYISFYYLVLKYYLPKISRILAVREKKISITRNGPEYLQQENSKVRKDIDTLVSQSLSLSGNVLKNIDFSLTKWRDQSLTTINNTQLKPMNTSYIHYLGEESLSQNISLYQASSSSPVNLRITRLFSKMKNLKKHSVPGHLIERKSQVLKKMKTVPVQESSKKSKKNKKK